MDDNQTIETLAEELSHSSIGYQARDEYDPSFYSLSAYASAYMLCEKYGRDTSGFSFYSIAEVGKNFDTDEKRDMLAKSAEAAKFLSYKIDQALEPSKSQQRGKTTFAPTR